MSGDDLPYRDFYYPLNVFMHILTQEEGGVTYLHYGLFDRPSDSIATAQQRSTQLLLEHLPPPPASILDVGAGLGTTLVRLRALGYDAEGITPDEKQVSMIRERHGEDVPVHCAPFQTFRPGRMYDCVAFQESAQYIDAAELFAHAASLTSSVVVLDEFAARPAEAAGSLHSLERFLACAAGNGFERVEEIDLSSRAAPTVDYFMSRLPRFRGELMSELTLTNENVEELIESGARYRDMYRSGAYVYRLLRFRRSV